MRAVRMWLALRALDLWLLAEWNWLFLLAVRLLPGDWCGDCEGGRAGDEEPF